MQRLIVPLVFVFNGFISPALQADILRWDNGELIPGTEGITPVPGINLTGFQLAFADLHAVDLSNAKLTGANLNNADLTAANLTNADLAAAESSNLGLGGAAVSFARLPYWTTSDQVYATKSYQDKNLQGVIFSARFPMNLRTVDLRFADLGASDFPQVDLTDALIDWATLSSDTFTLENLYSTASYKANRIPGVWLGWTFTDCACALAGADLSNQYLPYAGLDGADLSGANFQGANVAHARFIGANLANSNFAGANLAGADLSSAQGLESAKFSPDTIVDDDTNFPFGFFPDDVKDVVLVHGDFDGSGVLGHDDVDLQSQMVRRAKLHIALPKSKTRVFPFGDFDLNSDDVLNAEDLRIWVKDLRHTWFGDANLDGQFNTNDLVLVFQAGKYEDAVAGNSSWAEGDWDADGDFTTADFVVAFEDGGYQQGTRATVQNVPEPSASLTILIAISGLATMQRPYANLFRESNLCSLRPLPAIAAKTASAATTSCVSASIESAEDGHPKRRAMRS